MAESPSRQIWGDALRGLAIILNTPGIMMFRAAPKHESCSRVARSLPIPVPVPRA
jgi:hypothetical protein